MANTMINADNWTYTHYKATDMKAFISFGASADILDDSFIYMTTILDSENNEIFQKDFSTVDDACHFINNKYSNLWDFVDARSTKKEGGCSSCTAH
jgi:hypothetical protein